MHLTERTHILDARYKCRSVSVATEASTETSSMRGQPLRSNSVTWPKADTSTRSSAAYTSRIHADLGTPLSPLAARASAPPRVSPPRWAAQRRCSSPA
eukprot:CAMPEP_0174232578 /NCGR_PEP_ID=MMETSP0417-20130205/2824_1 /TAXON_ID=242541 /ORGANISM="Mayorella sp, Strain BSH-02190019" /LENGTH=97 /DNA_ID=CAMNT_0015310651 /DNA_START=192 /DNA_END=481 /DNA_ORIENTATION=+